MAQMYWFPTCQLTVTTFASTSYMLIPPTSPPVTCHCLPFARSHAVFTHAHPLHHLPPCHRLPPSPRHALFSFAAALVTAAAAARRLDDTNPQNSGNNSNNAKDQGQSVGVVTGTLELLLVGIYSTVACTALTCAFLIVLRKLIRLYAWWRDPAAAALASSAHEGLSSLVISWIPVVTFVSPGGDACCAAPAAAAGAGADAATGVDAEPACGAADAGAAAGGGGGGRGGDAEGGAAMGDVEGGREGVGDLMCAICLADFEGGDQLRVVPHCFHQYHKACLDPWLETKAICPLCKQRVRPVPSQRFERYCVPMFECIGGDASWMQRGFGRYRS
ncbi:hypothetical protein JKP88DRAFT_293527 [Tribonema minus]|uniref:RING-type domain-containing protein n=1 Tax=Tribonema minus TaxID=303371 RepID=A0A835ZK41_9STRA|nr:hypothetical protein JKP88DRAFT_293527 [Tribonema minus]